MSQELVKNTGPFVLRKGNDRINLYLIRKLPVDISDLKTKDRNVSRVVLLTP